MAFHFALSTLDFNPLMVNAQSSIVNQKPPRLWEIDTLRGAAVVAMMFFHFMWDLYFFNLTTQNIVGAGWQTFARGIGTTFIFLLGVSVTLDYSRMVAKGISPFTRTLRRGLTVFGCGLIVSVATYFALPGEWVRFGILHHAGVAIILAFFFMRLPAPVSLVIGGALIALGSYIGGLRGATSEWLIPLGFVPNGVGMADYYPLLPWFGVALLGVATGKWLYPNGQRQFALPDVGNFILFRVLRFLGRHSLIVYLLHQPILIALIIASGLVPLSQLGF